MIFERLFHKSRETKNVELLTKLFITILDSICESLTDAVNLFSVEFLKDLNEVYTPTFKAASRLEVGIYLLFRLDCRMCNEQEENVRKQLFYSCTKALLPSDYPHFVDIINHRLKIYGDYFNETKNSGGTWADIPKRCHTYLINAIYGCGDKYEKMTAEPPFVLVGAIEGFYLKKALMSCELHIMTMFDCALKHIFEGNRKFSLLSQKEIIKRIKNGFQEGQSITKDIGERTSAFCKVDEISAV